MKRSVLSILTGLLLAAALVLSACQNPVDPSSEVPGSQQETEGTSTTSPTDPGTTVIPSSSTEEETQPVDTRIQFVPVQTSIFLRQDGTVLSAEVTSFDNSEFDTTRYTEDGLRTMVLDWVEEYNRSVGKTAVAVESVSVADKKATLVLSYDTTESFLGFQGSDFGVTALRSMTVGAAKKSDIALSSMKNAEGDPVTAAKALENNDWNLVEISGKVLVVTEDQILFCSESLTLTDEYSVRVSGDQPVYLIFK